MRTSLALIYLIVFFGIGFGHGMIYRRLCYWKRAGIYVENDEYRVGIFALSMVVVLYVIRVCESHFMFHHMLREGTWPLIWSIMYAWGITSGFGHAFLRKDYPTVTLKSHDCDTSAPPITGLPDE